MIRNLFGGSKCRTIDICDIFGDNSGKALYRLDGNANDESGNYHGTETAITYGGGVYERGAVFNGTSSIIANISLPSMTTSSACSFYINTATAANQGFVEYSNGTNLIAIYHTSTTLAVRVNALLYTATTTLPKSAFNHIEVSFATDVPTMYLNGVLQTIGSVGATAIAGTSGLRIGVANVATVQTYTNGSIDQVRIFNRAITATEVATLYAECAPTSTVDNINPFEDGSLKALYQFNGDATDKTGVYNGTATNVTYGTGKFGQCAVFNGTNSYIVPTVQPSTLWDNDFSISLWVNLAVMKGVSTTYLFSAFGTRNFNIQFFDNKFYLDMYSGVSNVVQSTAIYGINTWYHVSFVRSKTVGMKFYINGIANGTSSYTGDAVANANTDAIGARFAGDRTTMAGSIDQLRIFNKALTPMEVASLYNETTPLEEPMHSLVDPFKDGSGKALYRLDGNALDESGNYNGTATGTPVYSTGRFGRGTVSSNTNTNYITTAEIPSGSIKTVSIWINPTALPVDATFHTVYMNTTTTSNTNGVFIRYVSAGLYAIEVYFNIGGTRYYTTTNPQTAISLNSWTNIIVCLESNNTISLYKNGSTLVSSTPTTSGAVTYNGSLMFGQYNPNGSNNQYTFQGKIDQLRIFNRALTASEIQTLYTEI